MLCAVQRRNAPSGTRRRSCSTPQKGWIWWNILKQSQCNQSTHSGFPDFGSCRGSCVVATCCGYFILPASASPDYWPPLFLWRSLHWYLSCGRLHCLVQMLSPMEPLSLLQRKTAWTVALQLQGDMQMQALQLEPWAYRGTWLFMIIWQKGSEWTVLCTIVMKPSDMSQPHTCMTLNHMVSDCNATRCQAAKMHWISCLLKPGKGISLEAFYQHSLTKMD